MAGDLLTLVLLPLALACIMVTLGFSLTVEDFRRVVSAPRGVIIGLANLVVLAPALAFAIAELFDLEPVFAVGLVLLGASPGGTLANLLTHLARGETALSITMTGVSSVLAVVTVPVYLTLAIDHFGATGLDNDPEMLGIVARVFAVTVIPLAIGMDVRRRAPGWVAAHEGQAKRVAFGVFVLVVIGAVAAEFTRDGQAPRRARGRGDHAERHGDGAELLHRPRGATRRPRGDGDRARAGRPQRGAGDRGRLERRLAPHDPRRRLQLLHVHQRRAVRAADAHAQQRLRARSLFVSIVTVRQPRRP